MNNTMKLLADEPFSYELSYLVEEKNKVGPSTMYINGPYLMAEKKNKNGRVYSLSEMVPEVERYTTEMVKNGRSLGELNHPASVEVNPERSCHMVTEFKQEGNIFMGKSKILSTPMGQITRSLIMDGVKLGVSSRALGKLVPGTDYHAVQGFHLIGVDVVHDPSVSTAFVNGILESKDWIINKDGTIIEAYNNFENSISSLPRHSDAKEEVLKNAVAEFIAALKNKK